MPDPHTFGDDEPQPERFARDVDFAAPKPGRCLGYASFRDADHSWMLRVIEGPSREDLTFRGVATDFETVELLNFHASSVLLDTLSDNPLTPTSALTDLSIQAMTALEPSPPPIDAKIVWAIPGSERDLGPDAALVMFADQSEGEPPWISFTAVRRGWDPLSTIALVALVMVGGGMGAREAMRRGLPFEMDAGIRVGPAKARGKVKIGAGHPQGSAEKPNESATDEPDEAATAKSKRSATLRRQARARPRPK
jgi:hypothetical protein